GRPPRVPVRPAAEGQQVHCARAAAGLRPRPPAAHAGARRRARAAEVAAAGIALLNQRARYWQPAVTLPMCTRSPLLRLNWPKRAPGGLLFAAWKSARMPSSAGSLGTGSGIDAMPAASATAGNGPATDAALAA